MLFALAQTHEYPIHKYADTPVQYQIKLDYGMINEISLTVCMNETLKKQQDTEINLVNSYAHIYDTVIIDAD